MNETLSPIAADISGEQNNNNVFAYNLKPVFEACDHNGDGYVKVQDLIELGQQHTDVDGTQGDELALILKQLDADGDGRITFDEFNRKVPELLQSTPKDLFGRNKRGDGIHQPVKLVFSQEGDRAVSYTDSEGFYEENDAGSVSSASINELNGDLEDPQVSSHASMSYVTEPSYFAKMKRNTSIYCTYPPNRKSPRKLHPSLFDLQRRLSRTSEYQSQEEVIEPFGESDNWDQSLSPMKCGDSSSRLSFHRISGNLEAHRLREVQSARNSLHGSMEDVGYPRRQHSLSDSEGCYDHLSEEIKKLSSQVVSMKKDQDSHIDKQRRIHVENRVLLDRINVLEEQLIDQRNTSIETVEVEGQKYRKELNKIQRQHSESIDQLQMKIYEAELKIGDLQSIEPMLRKELERSLEERKKSELKIESLAEEICEKEKEIEHLKYQLKTMTEEIGRERNDHAGEIVLLTEEIESLRDMKNTVLYQCGERNDLMQKMELLKRDNKELQTSRDDLKNELIERSTMLDLKKERSLADELSAADKSDVLTALRSQEKENHRLKQYIDQLLILIMQSDPLLLEK